MNLCYNNENGKEIIKKEFFLFHFAVPAFFKELCELF